MISWWHLVSCTSWWRSRHIVYPEYWMYRSFRWLWKGSSKAMIHDGFLYLAFGIPGRLHYDSRWFSIIHDVFLWFTIYSSDEQAPALQTSGTIRAGPAWRELPWKEVDGHRDPHDEGDDGTLQWHGNMGIVSCDLSHFKTSCSIHSIDFKGNVYS